jgi:hypothetical protein
MTNPKLEAMKLFKQPEDPTPTMSEYDREQFAHRSNFERLKAERLAREGNLTLTK